jgi:hypothetical protein
LLQRMEKLYPPQHIYMCRLKCLKITFSHKVPHHTCNHFYEKQLHLPLRFKFWSKDNPNPSSAMNHRG